MKGGSAAEPRFFARAADFRRWLEKNHLSANELWVGFHKRHTGTPSIDWPQSVDCALCFGWIDGVRKSLGEASYVIRFTPRKPTSTWSAINIAKVADLTKRGLMAPAGLAISARRDPVRAPGYSVATRKPFDAATLAAFKARKRAWKFFEAQPPGYRDVVANWVMSAKREETRRKRLAHAVAESAAGRRLERFLSKAPKP
ncbi:MAG TPA: YdeI/OmpD-associated family protein [Usitatibacter sp.]|nr:YdeI/OmpD-associated family protein [Usitatibacter sp.]